METWHLWLIGYMASMSIGQYGIKVFIHKLHPYQILFYQYIASIITISVYLKLFRPASGFFDVPLWLIVIGFMYAVGIFSKYHAKRQSLSKTSVMGGFTNFIPITLAIIFLGEYKLLSPDTLGGIKKIIGILLTFLSVYLFYYKDLHKGSEKTFNYQIWIKWITINIIFIGLAKFIVRYAVSINEPLAVLRLQYIGSFVVIALLCLKSGQSIKIGKKNIIGSFVVGVFISSALAMLYMSLSLSSATQVFSIASILLTVILIVLGVAFFKEKITKRMIVPILTSLVAIYLLK